jgi:hypothetical protein
MLRTAIVAAAVALIPTARGIWPLLVLKVDGS